MRADIKWRVVSSRTKGTWQLSYTVAGKKPTSKQLGRLDRMSPEEAATVAETFLKNLEPEIITIADLVEVYQREEIGQLREHSQAYYRGALKNYILPRWGPMRIVDVKPYPVRAWLRELPLAPGSKRLLRSLLSVLMDLAILREEVPEGFQNRMNRRYVKIEEATRKVRKAKNLTPEEWHILACEVKEEPFHTLCMLRAACGLRISESLGLKWMDILWAIRKIEINRSVVHGKIGEVKSRYSAEPVVFGEQVALLLEAWRERTEYSRPEDWVFASPHAGGRMPWHYETCYRRILEAAERAGLGRVTTHALRHTHRSFLEDTGASDEVQQKMMRHSMLSTTKGYGDIYEQRKREAHDKVAEVVFSETMTTEELRALFGSKSKKEKP